MFIGQRLKIFKILMLTFLLVVSVFPFQAMGFDREVYNFNRIWYHPTIGFNKNGQGTLILAVTYTNNTLRNIDYCSVEYTSDPFYISFYFEDELEIIRDSEGNIIFSEPMDGYMYLRKSVVDTHFPDNIKRLASKNLNYTTISYNGDLWYRVHVPNFNKQYEWKKFQSPSSDKWYTWGSNDSVSFNVKAMYVSLLERSMSGIILGFSHPTDNTGQMVAIAKSYLNTLGINDPVFEWGHKKPWKQIPYTENTSHYFIYPEHFSSVGIHDASSGGISCGFVDNNLTAEGDNWLLNDSGESLNGVIIEEQDSYVGSSIGSRWQSFCEPETFMLTRFRIFTGDDTGSVTGRIKDSTSSITYASATTATAVNNWITFDIPNIVLEAGVTYRLHVGSCKWKYANSDVYPNGTASFDSNADYSFKIYGYYINGNRTSGSTTERNIITDTLSFNLSTTNTTTIVVPVSTSVQAITEVWNVTSNTVATEVNSTDKLVNNTYYFDSANDFVYIGTMNLSDNQFINWSVNCSYGAEFLISPPTFLLLGHPFEFIGLIKDSNGDGIDGYNAEIRIMYTNGTDAVTPVEHNCTGGNVFCTISTCSLVPGEYDWQVSFTDSGSGVTFSQGGDLSISTGTSGHYDARAVFNIYDNSTGTSSHSPSFTFYDPNTGTGINDVFLKLYVSEDTSFTESDRVYQKDFKTYTGQTLYYKVDDYFGNKIYPDDANYETVVVDSVDCFVDIPIQMWMFSVKNMNHSIVLFELHNGSRAYQAYLFPYEPFYWYVFNGSYDINITYYNPETDAVLDWYNTTINIDNLTYYWIRGYDLQDIIIEIQFTNTTINDFELSITTDLSFVNSTVNTITTNINTNLTLMESNLTTLNNQIWNAINVTDSMVEYINNTIWNEISAINLTIDYLNNTIWNNFTVIESDIDSLNVSIHSNVTFDDTNLTNIIYNVWNSLNISNSTIDDINASIWNNFTFIENTLNDMNLSIKNVVYLVENNITSLVIEIENIIDYALTPDEVIWSYNPTIIFSCFDRYGMMLGNDIWHICPAVNVIATTRNETYGANYTSYTLIPDNGTVENGTITVEEDVLYFSGTADWVNISYANNWTEIQNTSYIPNPLYLVGQNISINASHDISVQRETTYNQQKKFYWDVYNSTNNPGYIEGRAGYHRAGLTIDNPLDTPLYNVYIYAGFSNKTTPDLNSVRVTDVENGIIMEIGENYKTSGDGVEWKISGGMTRLEEREFIVEYYRHSSGNFYYGEALKEILQYQRDKSHDGEFYNYFEFIYSNSRSITFKGSIRVKLGFSCDLDPDSVLVYDLDHGDWVDDSYVIVGEESILIDHGAVGDIGPGGGRHFAVYFQELEYPGAKVEEWHLNTPIGYLGDLPVTWFLIFVIILFVPVAVGVGLIVKKRRYKTEYILMIMLGFGLIFTLWILQAKGV